jgi:Flp pilus assembly protein TadG
MTKTMAYRRKRQRGSAVVELAIGSGLILAAFTGTFEFGYTFYRYNNMQTAVNNGAKYAAFRTYQPTTSTPEACFQAAVQNMVVYGDPTGTTTTPVVPGLTPNNVFLTVTFLNGVPSRMTVGIASYTIDSVFARITLTNKPQATYPFLGRYAAGNGEACVQ